MTSTQRIYNLIKRDLVMPFAIPYGKFLKDNNWKTSIVDFAAWLPAFALIMGLFNTSLSGNREIADSGIMYGMVIAVMSPFLITREHCIRTHREFALMLPASLGEKFGAFVILGFVIIPAYCIITSGIGYYIGTLLGNGLFNGSFAVACDWQLTCKMLSPLGIMIAITITALGMFLSLLIKNEVIQAIIIVPILLVFVFASTFVLGPGADGMFSALSGKVATYIVYPLITIGLLAGSFIKLKRERA